MTVQCTATDVVNDDADPETDDADNADDADD